MKLSSSYLVSSLFLSETLYSVLLTDYYLTSVCQNNQAQNVKNVNGRGSTE